MPGEKGSKMEGLSPNIPIRLDYCEYAYDEDEVADSARTEASSARDYKYEHGRRYHAYREGLYPMPNDDLNKKHEEIAHHLFGIVLEDKLYLPPIEEPTNVLDLGTGIGLWAIDMAERYQDAKILGKDLTPGPECGHLYNLQFEVDDITSEWMPGEGYDLVHMRLLFGSIGDWPSMYARIFENLKSDGWLQHVEIEIKPRCDDGTLPADNVFQKWADLAEELTEAGRGFSITENMRPQMEAAGFVDIVEKRYKLPLGPWSSNALYQQIGFYFEMFWRTGCQGWLMGASTRDLGWTPSKVNGMVEEVFKLVDSRTAHVYYNAVVVYGRKP